MILARRILLTTAIAAIVAFGSPASSRSEDAPSAPAPAAEREAALKRAADLDREVERLYGSRKYGDAVALARESVSIRERALGKGDPDLATSLNNLAAVLQAQGSYDEARPLFERSLAIREEALGRDDPLVATSLGHLASLLAAQGSSAEARPLYERALAIRERALGEDAPAVATSLNNLAELLRTQGAYAEARPLYERALAIREKASGKDHVAVASILNNLALLLAGQGSSAEARTVFERALAIHEKALAKDDPEIARNLNNFAWLLAAQGSYAEARPLYERALAIREKALGADHAEVAQSLHNLAGLLHAQGSFAEARPLYERALAIREKVLGEDHPAVATTLNNLAFLLEAQGSYAEARPRYERALAIREKRLGPTHEEVARTLNNLAVLLSARGSLAEARALHERALAIFERALGMDHAEVATSLNNLALLLKVQGSYAEARVLYERSLAIKAKALGSDHPSVATGLHNLASLLRAQGSFAEAQPLHERALAIDEANVRTQFSALSAAQRLARMRSGRSLLESWIECSPHVGLSGHAEVLRFRGLVTRAERAERTLTRRATDEQRATLAALQAATRLAARLANQPPAGPNPQARAVWQEQYAQAAAERERRTREVTSRAASARAALERLDLRLADVQRAIPSDTALVDVLRVRDRYLGWIVRSTGDPVRLDLGAADAIEAACAAFVSAVAEDGGDAASADAIRAAGDALKATTWAPLAARLDVTVARIVICPDAALASVPFAALPGKDADRALIDDLAISYVFHPFDLVAREDAPPPGVGAVVVGGVDYEQADAGSPEAPLPARPPVLAPLDRAPRGGSFGPIPGTRLEAEALRDRLGKDATTLLLGPGATEARFREAVKGRRIVHVATHGFARTDLLAGLRYRKVKDAFLSADAERQLAVGHDPMLLSGLAFAGANPREGAGGDDGILTALEASYLDLDGVDLVTLSACETAKGTAESGEGVLGLVSAFQMAGARRVLASLWKVDDAATQRLMEGVYERMLRKEHPLSPADALREAALALRASKDATGKARFAAPRYWAAFVAYGG